MSEQEQTPATDAAGETDPKQPHVPELFVDDARIPVNELPEHVQRALGTYQHAQNLLAEAESKVMIHRAAVQGISREIEEMTRSWLRNREREVSGNGGLKIE